MNENVSHLLYYSPRCFGMLRLKFFGQFVDSFAYNLDIIDSCMETEFISLEFFFTDTARIFLHTCNSRKNVLQPCHISFRLSHTLIFCHD